jgi:AAA15 family ATPase/GTPase
MSPRSTPVPMITRVRLRNYRSIAECDVQLGPLTILVGPNGSGKRNFLCAHVHRGCA